MLIAIARRFLESYMKKTIKTIKTVEEIRYFVEERVRINGSAIMMNRLNCRGLELKFTAQAEEAQKILNFIDGKNE